MNSVRGVCGGCEKLVSLYKEIPEKKDSRFLISSHHSSQKDKGGKYVECIGSRKPPLTEKEPVAQK